MITVRQGFLRPSFSRRRITAEVHHERGRFCSWSRRCCRSSLLLRRVLQHLHITREVNSVVRRLHHKSQVDTEGIYTLWFILAFRLFFFMKTRLLFRCRAGYYRHPFRPGSFGGLRTRASGSTVGLKIHFSFFFHYVSWTARWWWSILRFSEACSCVFVGSIIAITGRHLDDAPGHTVLHLKSEVFGSQVKQTHTL